MNDLVCVYGLGRLGLVTAACVALSGRNVLALDSSEISMMTIESLEEPGLSQRFENAKLSGQLKLSADVKEVAQAGIVWVTFDVPISDGGRGLYWNIANRLESIYPYVRDDATILISSQVPVGFTKAFEEQWEQGKPNLKFAYSPENLRVGRAIEGFLNPGRVVIGCGENTNQDALRTLFEPFCRRILWMSLASAEMSKHALNGLLAATATYANEVAGISREVGADYRAVQSALRSDPRVGHDAYVAEGPITGGHLMREIHLLRSLGKQHGIHTPLIDAVTGG